MFNVAKIADVVQVEPKNFGLPGLRLVEDTLNAKYADKVIPEVGLALGVYTLDKIGDGLIGHSGTGIVNLHAEFSLVVFRPHLGEIIRGKVSSMDPVTGIWLTLDFFDEINIPPEQMFENMEWREEGGNAFGGVWVWKPADEEGNPGTQEFFVDENEILAVRVEEEKWVDVSLEQQERRKKREAGEEEEGEMRQPYAIVASMGMTGLGPEFWWTGLETDAVGRPLRPAAGGEGNGPQTPGLEIAVGDLSLAGARGVGGEGDGIATPGLSGPLGGMTLGEPEARRLPAVEEEIETPE